MSRLVTVCIPYGGHDPHRERALTYVTGRYADLGWEVRVGVGDHLAWRKAIAVQDAVDRSTGTMLVIADADCWSDHIQQAVDAVQDGVAFWSTPHDRVDRLTEDSTTRFLAGSRDRLELEEQHHGLGGGGIVVLRRETYEQVPLDPRFCGWGGEDKAWARALRTLAGRPYRVQLPLWHLWHLPQERLTRAVGSEANDALLHRYERASLQPRQMRSLIEEGRAWAHQWVQTTTSSTKP